MKHVKKLASVLLAMVMVMAMTMTAFAANVTIADNLRGHTFTAYQIFTGTQSENEEALGDVAWGSGINSEAFLTALKDSSNNTVSTLFADCGADAASVVAELATLSDSSAEAIAVAQIAYEYKKGEGTLLTSGTNELATGYYLIVDTTSNISGDDAYNAALLQVTDDININVKTSKPSVEKKVKENTKYTNNDTSEAGYQYGVGYNDVADYNIGDDVPFEFYSKVPDMTYYETYKYVFHDVMSDGLTLNKGSIEVWIGNKQLTLDVNYTVVTNTDDECDFEVIIADLKTLANEGDVVYVKFTAELNSDAVIGLNGNTNKVKLEYSNNPDESGTGDDKTGETPWDEVIVFTYELDVTKVDGEDATKTLEGAEFKLHNRNGQWVIVDKDNKVTGWSDTEEDGSTLVSGSDGLFKVIGLDAGTYYLKETKAPAGYNLLTSEITLVIEATTNNGQNTWGTDKVASTALTALKISVNENGTAATGNTETGVVNATVENNQGSTLPETGGMGTTIFYVIGSILVLGAAVVMITRKRMAK